MLFLVACSVAVGLAAGQAGQSSPPLKVTHEVTFFIAKGDNINSPTQSLGEVKVGLFGEIVPGTVKNFWHLSGGPGIAFPWERRNGRTYNSSRFHRVIKDFMIQGGDVVKGDGTGSISLYGRSPMFQFIDENFIVKHFGEGWVAMANSGPNTNGCQFYITLAATPHLDGKHVVFGKVVEGLNVIRAIGNVEVDPARGHRPVVPVWIYSTTRKQLSPQQQYVVQPN